MPYVSKELEKHLKKERREQEALQAEERRQQEEETARLAEEARKRAEDEAQAIAEKEKNEKARQLEDLKALKERERRNGMRQMLDSYRNVKCDPIELNDEDVFKTRHGLFIGSNSVAAAYHSTIYPVIEGKPTSTNKGPTPYVTGEDRLVVKTTVLDKFSTEYRKHFRSEALKAIKFLGSAVDVDGTLRHPSLVRVFEIFVIDNRKKVYIFMPELPQPNLRNRIYKPGVPPGEISRLARQIGEAVLFLHNSSLAHLNVRSDNFMIANSGQVKMVGLSRLYVYWNPQEERVIRHVPIREKNFIDHFPPEVFNQDFDPLPVDVFSFGILLYHMIVRDKPLRKQQPFTGSENMREMWDQHCAEPKEKNKMKAISSACLDLIERMVMVSTPEQRPLLSQVLEHQFFKPTSPINDKGKTPPSLSPPPSPPAPTGP